MVADNRHFIVEDFLGGSRKCTFVSLTNDEKCPENAGKKAFIKIFD